MRRKYYNSLRFKITVGLLLSLIVVLAITSYLRYVSFRRLLVESLELSAVNTGEIVEAQLAAYLRSRLILSASSIAVTVLIAELMMSKLVISRLRQLWATVKRVGSGDLNARVAVGGRDEITELAAAFNIMTADLQRQDEKLSALYLLATTVSQSLDLQQVLRSSLDEVLELMRLRAGWITLRDHHGEELRLAASRGLPEEAVLAHARCNWMQCICAEVFESGQSQVSRNLPKHPCPAAEYLQREGFTLRACIPLRSKDQVLGVMSLAGVTSGHMWMFTEDSLETLTAIGRQIGIALENVSLYEELRQTDMLRRQLLERRIDLQEEERRRIARELHDQASQRLTSIIMTLGVLGKAESMAEVRAHVRDLRDTAVQTLEEVHNLALELRPRLLDDLGLLAALRHYLGEFRDRFHVPADFHVLGLGDRRLPSRVETALYRIAQEALTNTARHAQARSVGVLLEVRSNLVMLIVEDDGEGFDVAQVMGSHVHAGNLGLYGMRERASLLGGTVTVESTLGMGTTVFVEIPLTRQEGSYEKDPSADS